MIDPPKPASPAKPARVAEQAVPVSGLIVPQGSPEGAARDRGRVANQSAPAEIVDMDELRSSAAAAASEGQHEAQANLEVRIQENLDSFQTEIEKKIAVGHAETRRLLDAHEEAWAARHNQLLDKVHSLQSEYRTSFASLQSEVRDKIDSHQSEIRRVLDEREKR